MMEEHHWYPLLIFFFIIPTILLSARIYFDTAKYLRSGYLASSLISLIFAIGSYFFFVVAYAMTLYRAQNRLMGMDVVDYSKGRNPVPASMEALHQPLHEATIVHSFIIPTGLWLCKASFVAMYFNLKRHLNVRTKRLLYFTVFYLVATFIVLVLTHALWCGPKFGHTWTETSTRFCTPFANTASIVIYAFMNITSDICVLAIPLMILHYITVLPRERYAIMFLLFLGFATIVTTAACCGLHITYRKQILVYYSYIQLAELLACVELAVAVAAVSLPSLKAVLYLKQEHRRNKITSSGVGSSKRTACTTGEWDEDEGRLVIMRRMSYDVESMEAPKEAVIKAGRA